MLFLITKIGEPWFVEKQHQDEISFAKSLFEL